MSDVFRKQTVVYQTADGKKCRPGTPGAKQIVIKSRKWYGRVGGKQMPLSPDKARRPAPVNQTPGQ